MPLTGDFNHLFIRQGTGLQGQAVFRTKLTFRPSSTNSLTHRKMMGRLAHRINHSVTKVKGKIQMIFSNSETIFSAQNFKEYNIENF